MTSVTELTFSCFAHSLARTIACSVDVFQTNGDLVVFCQRQKQHFRVAKALEDAFAKSLFNSFVFNVLILITSSYLCVVNFMGLYWDDNLPSYTSAMSSLVLSVMSGIRIMDLANNTQRVFDKFASALDCIDLLESVDDFATPEAKQIRALLTRGDGLPLRGYFVINRGVLLAIMGNILTYLIILIEFEMDDQEDEENCFCPNNCTAY